MHPEVQRFIDKKSFTATNNGDFFAVMFKSDVEQMIEDIETLGFYNSIDPEPVHAETITKAQQLEAFQCKVCGEQFGNTSDLYDHYDEKHNHPE